MKTPTWTAIEKACWGPRPAGRQGRAAPRKASVWRALTSGALLAIAAVWHLTDGESITAAYAGVAAIWALLCAARVAQLREAEAGHRRKRTLWRHGGDLGVEWPPPSPANPPASLIVDPDRKDTP